MVQVLIFDEDDAIREIVRVALEGEGYGVLEAASPQAALDQLRASPGPVVVLFNNVLPGRGDAAFLRAVLADSDLLARHVYVCFTANPTRILPELLDTLGRLGIPVITKPFDLDVLFATVKGAAEHIPAVQRASWGRS
jgi:CheY-like chemotaxis protein